MDVSLVLMLLCVTGCSVLVVGEPPCTFPDFLQNSPGDVNDYWNFGTTLAGSSHKAYVNGTTFAVIKTQWGGDETPVSHGQCYQTATDVENTYIAEVNKNGNKTYVCVQYISRSPQVVTVKHGKLDDTPPAELKCALVTFETSPWPIVANKPKVGLPSVCQLSSGGRSFRANITDKDGTKQVCADHPVPSLLERECVAGEGVNLVFPDKSCIPDQTGWGLEQHLLCQASWSDTTYIYALLRLPNHNPQWCMRTPSSSSQPTPERVDIFQDLICPPGDIPTGTSYITMETNPIITSTCDDAINTCNPAQCEGLYSYYCPKTCNTCPPTDAPCSFDEEAVTAGDWTEYRYDDQQYTNATVTLTSQDLTITYAASSPAPSAKFTCSKALSKELYVTLAEPIEGCRPRYTCAQFQRLTDPVLRYKLGQAVYVDTDEPCQDEQFQDDPAPWGSLVHSKYLKNIIATSKDPHTIPCGFGGNYTWDQEYNGDKCTGLLSDIEEDCQPQNQLNATLDCGDTSKYGGSFTCLGEFKPDESEDTVMLITTTEQGGNCWVRHVSDQEMWWLQAAECNEGTDDQLLSGEVQFVVHGVLNQTDDCGELMSTEEPYTGNSTEGPSTANPTGSPGGMGAGAIVGIIIAVGLLVAGLGFIVYMLYRIWRGHTRSPYHVL